MLAHTLKGQFDSWVGGLIPALVGAHAGRQPVEMSVSPSHSVKINGVLAQWIVCWHSRRKGPGFDSIQGLVSCLQALFPSHAGGNQSTCLSYRCFRSSPPFHSKIKSMGKYPQVRTKKETGFAYPYLASQ